MKLSRRPVLWAMTLAMSGWLGIAWAEESDSAGGREPTCTLVPLHTGVCQLGKDHVLGPDYNAQDRMPFVIYSFLVEGPDDEKALIDLGPKTVDYCNRMFRQYGFFRDLGASYPDDKRYPDDIVQPHGNAMDQLRAAGIPLTDIDHIVFTHLHADHHGMDDATNGGAAESFPQALLHVSLTGWNDNLAQRRDGGWNSYVDHAFSDYLARRQQAGKVRLADNAEIFPGVRTMYLGGHSVCSQAVIIETRFGTAIIASDEVYLYQLLEEGIMPRIRTSEARYREAIDRLVKLARTEDGILIPLHDPIVWDTYQRLGADWLTGLKSISDRAIDRYLSRN